jgi:hypothetical protein
MKGDVKQLIKALRSLDLQLEPDESKVSPIQGPEFENSEA